VRFYPGNSFFADRSIQEILLNTGLLVDEAIPSSYLVLVPINDKGLRRKPTKRAQRIAAWGRPLSEDMKLPHLPDPLPPPTPKAFGPGPIYVTPVSAEWMPYRTGLLVPSAFKVFVDNQADDPDKASVEFTAVVAAAEEKPKIVGVVMAPSRPFGSLTTESVRVPLNRYLNEALRRVAHRVVTRHAGPELERVWDGTRELVSDAGAEAHDERAKLHDEVTRDAKRSRQGRRLSDDDLKETARIYREAMTIGRNPTEAVQRELHLSRSTAGRWVMQARRRGFLGPAPAGRVAGEAQTTNQEEHDGVHSG